MDRNANRQRQPTATGPVAPTRLRDAIRDNGLGYRRDLTGQAFGSWTVLGFSHISESGARYWLCRCVCGTEKPVDGHSMTRGRNAGCWSCSSPASGTHGRALCDVWRNMRARCQDPQRQAWKHYGGRGIAVCERWQTFKNFYADTFPTYQPGLTLDRINTEGPYAPDNFRWATWTQQARNKRNNRLLAFHGHTATVAEWSEALGLNYGTVQSRIGKLGWSVERALTTGADSGALIAVSACSTSHPCKICKEMDR